MVMLGSTGYIFTSAKGGGTSIRPRPVEVTAFEVAARERPGAPRRICEVELLVRMG